MRKKSEHKMTVLRIRGKYKGKPYSRTFKSSEDLNACLDRYKTYNPKVRKEEKDGNS